MAATRRQLLPALLALLALLACFQAARAGCYGRGKPHRLGLYPREQWYLNHKPAPAANSLPRSFSWCDHNGTSMCTPSWNQHIPRYCGSCYVHGTLSMIQDRLKIRKLAAGDTSPDVMLGRQTFLNCGPFLGYSAGCDGGEPLEVFKYMAEEGLPDESCLHYAATDYTVFKKAGHKACPKEGRCLNCMPDPKHPDDYECWAIKRPINYKVTAYGKLEPGERAMQEELLARGPIVCGIACPDVFTYHYHSSKHNGVFIDKSGDTDIDHDIEVVGWGEDEGGLKYWVARNSWGTYWGELGFFKVQRGVNALQIESGDCWYAEPTHELEDAVMEGDYEGSMDGLKKGASKKKHGGKTKEEEEEEEEEEAKERAGAAQQQQQPSRPQPAAAAAQRAVARGAPPVAPGGGAAALLARARKALGRAWWPAARKPAGGQQQDAVAAQ